MSKNALSFVITHGNLAEALVEVSNLLTSPSVETYTYSNSVKSLDDLSAEISGIIEQHNPDNLVFFVDLMGGSCWMLINRLKQKYPHARLLAGVNIPMLISFQINYSNLSWDELMEKTLSDGKKGIISR
jgi:PTS system mannose-specific IIA component/fructoselysine and glucoselysine-specific PTS system IIA component